MRWRSAPGRPRKALRLYEEARILGPAIRAAEKALESGTPDALIKLLSQELTHGIAARFGQALSKKAATKEPTTKADVQAARERVSAELGLIGYVEGVHLAITGGGHAE